MKKYGLSGTAAIDTHSTFVLNLKKGKIDFLGNFTNGHRQDEYIDVNQYWYQDHFSGVAKRAIAEIYEAIMESGKWFDNSDAQTDYFHTAFYIRVSIGKWNKPYILE